MEKRIALAIMFMFLLFPAFSMSNDGGNVPVVKEATKNSAEIEKIYEQICDLPQSDAKTNLIRIHNTVVSPELKLVAEEIYELGRPNFRGKLEESLVFIELVLEYKYSTPEAKKEAMLGILNISTNKKLYTVDDNFKLFEKHKEELIPKLRYVLSSDCKILVIRAASMLILLGEDKKDFISIFEDIAYGKDQENWNVEATTLFGDDKLYLSYIRRGSDFNDIRESAVDEIRMESFINLFNANRELSIKVANDILSKEGDYFAKRKQIDQMYKLLHTRIKNFLKKYDSKEDEGNLKNKIPKYTTTNSSEIWLPDSSAAYCERFVGDSLGTYSDEGYNTLYHNHTDTGSDCANFGTQCLKHGGLNFKNANAPVNYVCTYNANTDGNVCVCDNQHAYLNNRQDIKVTSSVIESSDENSYVPDWLRIGDIAIVGNSDNDKYQHTIIKHYDDGIDSFFGAHTNNRISWKLSSYVTTNTTGWNNVTFYHVVGSTVLENPAQEELTLVVGDSLDLKALATNNTDPTSLNPITNFKFALKKKPENTETVLYETTDPPPSADSTYVYGFKVKDIPKGDYVLYASTTYSEGSTIDSCTVTVRVAPKFVAPTPREIHFVKTSNKNATIDTLAIKVRVPEILGVYPEINILIDDVYVNQGDIIFDTEENVWIYNWDLSGESPTASGKFYAITAEIDGDPTDKAVSSVFLVEALFNEEFETITDLTGAGWVVSSYEYPVQTYTGWWIGNDELDPVNQCSKSLAFVNSTAMAYRLYSPAFTVPSDPDAVTKLEYKLYLNISSLPKSLIKFYICNASNTTITPALELNQFAIDGSWVNLEYDLSEFAGQTIKLHWNNYYNSTTPCKTTTYQLDDILVYTIPDMDGPSIDFIAGNTADLNEDMNLTLGFNDYSGISGVSADYTIDGSSGSLSFYPVKGTYNYAGTLPAKDHECSGLITYKLTDSVGNETVSSGHYIGWALGGGVLSAPENVVISALNDSTLSVTWDIVDGATGYKVYSSVDPYGTFSEDSTGTFTESRKWEKIFDGNKYFYYVIATNPTKFDVEAIKEEDFEIAKAKEENVSDR